MSASLAVHTMTSTLVLPSSHPSSLQIYSPSYSKLISELEVSPSNRISRRDEQPLEPARVEHTVISPSGEWMATIDSREADNNFQCEIYLKIWWWDRKTSHWILNTRIDRPHGLKKVSSITFNPGIQGLNLVTTGHDGNVKAWRTRRTKNKEGQIEGSDLV
jgi:NET1-associated nuclear protein 1 (U3 small nucleolar RNA-associated protein 17)